MRNRETVVLAGLGTGEVLVRENGVAVIEPTDSELPTLTLPSAWVGPGKPAHTSPPQIHTTDLSAPRAD